MKIVIIDYQMSNMFSVKNALDKLDYSSIISSDPNVLNTAEGAILPGVGSFPEAMKQLERLNLINSIKNFINSGKPFMGICLGFQLLFTKSSEFKTTEGLNILNGDVNKIQANKSNVKVPMVGWYHTFYNKINPLTINNKQIVENDYYYFVHSYYVKPQNLEIIHTFTKYNELTFCSSIKTKNIFACQFHPEKSGLKGIEIFKNFFKKTIH